MDDYEIYDQAIMRLMCRAYQDWQEPGCSVDLALESWSASFRKTSGRVGGIPHKAGHDIYILRHGEGGLSA